MAEGLAVAGEGCACLALAAITPGAELGLGLASSAQEIFYPTVPAGLGLLQDLLPFHSSPLSGEDFSPFIPAESCSATTVTCEEQQELGPSV